MREPTPVRYRLSAPLSGVKLKDHPGSSLRSPTEALVSIPAGAIVELEGTVAKSGLVNVIWNGEVFSVFFDDISQNT